jgi:hypothetical protein
MKPSILTMVAVLVLIGAGGFMAGRISSTTPPPDPAAQPAATKSPRSLTPAATSTGTAGISRRDIPREAATQRQDRLARLESIVRGEDPLDRNRALLAYVDSLGPDELADAVARFRALGITESRMGEYAILLSAWAKLDPLAALDYTTKNTGGNFANNTILTTWAATDPEAAIRWAQTHHEGDGANPYLAGIIRSLGATDPTRATGLLAGMPRSRERGEALDAMLPHLLVQGNAATRSWIDDLDDEALRSGAMMRVADKLAATDPAGTAAWLLANPSEASQRRMDDVYSVWARNDEQAAVSSLAALPVGENRSNALRGVVTGIAIQNPSAAVSMMDRFPDDVTDRTVQQFVWHSFGNDPATAVSQIPRITNEGQRNRMYNRTLSSWLDRDPSSAADWIRSNPLPDAVRDSLKDRIN